MPAFSWSNFGYIIDRALALFSKTRIPARAQANCTARLSHSDVRNPPPCSQDVSLLCRRMALLRIDADELASENSLLARELQVRCAFCHSREQCVEHLSREEHSGEPQEWREYCSGGALLNVIAAAQNCPHAAQYVKVWPYPMH
jgi:hypothetical protein